MRCPPRAGASACHPADDDAVGAESVAVRAEPGCAFVTPGLDTYELRHTAASLAIHSGANVKTVQRMLGHRSAAMTLDIYGHLWDEELDALPQRMSEHMKAERERFEQRRLRAARHQADTKTS
ncbi:tyrosine-type recombinase/integrase [Rhodococcus sp. ACT016]|uniref:tyrosine-type recombinase/integrase n=1 Tax=Rhodococcus sp. ACT016 TaxID=3134808 RepID=UPI003D2C9E8D